MTLSQMVGAFLVGALKGLGIILIVSIVLMGTIKGCSEVLAQTATYDSPGYYDPMEDVYREDLIDAIEEASVDVTDALEAHAISQWDPTSYIECLSHNENIYRMANKEGDTGLKLSPKYDARLRACWRLTP